MSALETEKAPRRVLIVGEAPSARGGGFVKARVSELAGHPWEEWADWVNLLDEWPGSGRGKGTAWNGKAAHRAAAELDLSPYDAAILLGRRVAAALIPGGAGFPFFRWVEHQGAWMVVIPHTSGIVRWWNEPENVEQASSFLAGVAEIAIDRRYHGSIPLGIADGGKPPEEGERGMPTSTKTRGRAARKTAAASRKAATQRPAATTRRSLAGVSPQAAAIAVFRAAGKPLAAAEVAAVVIGSGVKVEGKGVTPLFYRVHNPIYREAKRGHLYRKVGKSTPAKFDLRADAPESDPELVETFKGHVGEIEKANEVAAAAREEWNRHAAKLDGAKAAKPAAEAKPDPKGGK